MGALTPIAQPMQFNRMQPPDDAANGELAPALFVTEMKPIGQDLIRSLSQGVAWSIPAPADQILPNRLILGEYLNKLDQAVGETLAQACIALPQPARVVCKRAFDGALTVVIATPVAQSLVDAIARIAPGVGAFFTLNPWDALEAATPTLAEAIEARAFWPVLKKMLRDGEDMSEARQIRLCFIPRTGVQTPPDWDALSREAREIGFTPRLNGAGLDLDAATVLSGDEVNKMAQQVAIWIERYRIGFDGWEAENLRASPPA
jgi:hypothetical protein